MNRKSPILLLAAIVFCAVAYPVRAQEASIFIEGGGSSFIGLDNEFGGTASFGLEAPYFGIRATGSVYTDDTEYFTPYGFDYLPAGLYGEADLYRLSIDLYAKFDWDFVTLYAGAGISWYSLEATVDFHFAHRGYYYDGYIDIDGDSDLCFNTFAGIRVFLLDPLYIFAEVRYDIETDLELEVDDITIAEFEDLGGVSVVGGIGLRF